MTGHLAPREASIARDVDVDGQKEARAEPGAEAAGRDDEADGGARRDDRRAPVEVLVVALRQVQRAVLLHRRDRSLRGGRATKHGDTTVY